MPSVETYTRQFSAKYPEAGEFSRGAVINAEQAKKLGDIFSVKVTELSRKADLTDTEKTFLDNVVDVGTRNLVVRPGTQLPTDGSNARELIKAAAHMYRESSQAWPLQHEVSSSQDMHEVMNGLTGNAVDLRRYPHLRTPVEDYAMHIMPFFGEVVSQNGGMELDDYVSGNLKYLLSQYEMVEQQPA
jgi:hypothetical protein